MWSEFELYSLQILPHISRFAVNLLRIGKEVKMYEKEAKDLEEKVKQMEGDGKDEYDIRKQVWFQELNCEKLKLLKVIFDFASEQ